MTALLVATAAVVGLLIGSFLNVVVWRVPRGESVVRPPSHCPSCGNLVRPRDNVPVLGWLVLRGRCRDCGAGISGRYPVVEALTGVLFGVTAARLGPDPALPAFLYLVAVGLALALIDLDVKRLPDVLTLPSYVVGIVLLAVAAGVQGEWGRLGRALLGMAVLYAMYLALHVLQPRGMGFGDVKLAGVLGLFLGYLGWAELAVGAFLGFVFGGVWGIGLLVARKGGRKTKVPFGPFMLAGAYVALLAGGVLFAAYTGASGL